MCYDTTSPSQNSEEESKSVRSNMTVVMSFVVYPFGKASRIRASFQLWFLSIYTEPTTLSVFLRDVITRGLTLGL
jgi:hypothetical protein